MGNKSKKRPKKQNHGDNANWLATAALITVILELVKALVELIQTIIEHLS